MKGLKKLLTVGVAVALLVSLLVPGAAVFAEAGTDGGVTGTLTGGNAAPTVTSVEFYNGAMSEKITALDPDTEVAVKIVAADNNTIDDIKQLDIHIYYDTDGTTDPAAWDADACAIYKWLKSGDIWSLEDGSATNTWAVDDDTSTIPGTMSDLSGTWYLVFTPGKLAQETDGTTYKWYAKVIATDVADQPGNGTTASGDAGTMAAYCSITSDLSAIAFGIVALSGTAVIPETDGYDIKTSVTANDSYALKFHSEATWTTGTKTIALEVETTPGEAEFRLDIDDAGTLGVPTEGQQVQNSATTIAGHTEDGHTATEPAANEGTSDENLYIQVTLGASGVRPEEYTGTVTFTVENS